MNGCEKWKFCPLGDMAKLIGCRKPGCPEKTFASVPSAFSKDTVVHIKKK
ncbi:MAG: hypothetical protein MIO90_00515 [Methanomassiliicoccales archaeon]|nr:hypothetical protein [Methanomassiliicoccales archaeon]